MTIVFIDILSILERLYNEQHTILHIIRNFISNWFSLCDWR